MSANKEIRTLKHVTPAVADFVMISNNERFSDHYDVDPNVIGEGAFARVHKCVKKGTHEERAVKIMEKSKMSEQQKVRLKYEVEILKNLNHPNIVRLYEVFEDKHIIYLVTELCDGRELFDEI